MAHLIVSYAALLILLGLGPLAVREIAAQPERSLEVFGEVLVARLLLAGPALLGVWVFWPYLRRLPGAVLIAVLLLVIGSFSAWLYTANRVESVAAAPAPESGPRRKKKHSQALP